MWIVPVIASDVNIIDMLKIPFVSSIAKHVWGVPRTGSSRYYNWGLFRSLYHGSLSVRMGSAVVGSWEQPGIRRAEKSFMR
jgi:hypothetical protein